MIVNVSTAFQGSFCNNDHTFISVSVAERYFRDRLRNRHFSSVPTMNQVFDTPELSNRQ